MRSGSWGHSVGFNSCDKARPAVHATECTDLLKFVTESAGGGEGAAAAYADHDLLPFAAFL